MIQSGAIIIGNFTVTIPHEVFLAERKALK